MSEPNSTQPSSLAATNWPANPDIPGLQIVENYLTTAEEQELFGAIDTATWLHDLKRRVQHYGYRYDYKARKVTSDAYLGPLPDWSVPLAQRLCQDGWFAEPPVQLIVNEYQPGQGIAAHVDCVPCFGPTIVSVTLQSGCTMVFRELASKTSVEWYLQPRSVLVLTGAARYDWQHAIPARQKDSWHGQVLPRGRRISLTFRTIRRESENQTN